MATHRYTAFGLRLRSELPLPGLARGDENESADVRLVLADPAAVAEAWSGSAGPPESQSAFDGCSFRIERGWDGDRLYRFGDRAVLHLSADLGTLICAPADVAHLSWRRVLLDTALVSVSFYRGFEAVHASAVESALGLVAFVGVQGGGKTTLAAELLSRGWRLFCDDVLALRRSGERVLAHPGPALMNLPRRLETDGAPGYVGEVLARFGDESWVTVDSAASRPRPVAAVYFVDRRPEADTTLEQLDATPLHLLPHALHGAPERAGSRFELFADVAAHAPFRLLRAAERTPVAELADLVERSLETSSRRAAA